MIGRIIGAVVGGSAVAYSIIKSRKKRKENEERNKKFIEKLKNSLVYIDTNFLLDRKYELLFDIIIKEEIKIQIPSVQYNELINLKNKENENISFALKYIERFIDNDNVGNFIDDKEKKIMLMMNS